MREISCNIISDTVKKLFGEANTVLPESLKQTIISCKKAESNNTATACFDDMIENLTLAKAESLPICQDTGMAIVFIEIGQDVHIIDGDLEESVNKGVHDAYIDGAFRCSVVKDPVLRGNTGDNTPAIIYTKIVKGDKIAITAAPKGFGSENMSRLKMFTPSASEQDIIDFVTETVNIAGSNPCPPVVVGVGIGGDFEYSAFLAKKALCRDVNIRNENGYYAELEEKMLSAVNKLNIGAQGFGGDITALAVNIETYPTHIAGLPVAVNIGCHVTRHASCVI